MRKSKIISLSLTDQALKYAEEYSKADGKSRSAVISEAVTKYYAMRKLNELAEYGNKKFGKKTVDPLEEADRLVHEYREEKRKAAAHRAKQP